MEIKRVAIYGAGLIGAGWLTHLLVHNVPLSVCDVSADALLRCRERAEQDLNFLSEEGVITAEDIRSRLSAVRFTTDPAEALWDADLIQENVPERLELKQQVLSTIEAYCRDEAVICTSTSGISVTKIAANARRPQRVIGAHPYHPVYLLPLIEMIRGEKTEESYLQAAFDFYKRVCKEPVVLKREYPGYIASHLMSVLFRESTHMIMDGVATMEDIDTAFTYGPGMRYGLMGINMTLQLAGGEHGLAGTLLSGIGSSGGNWMESFANFTQWPEEYHAFWESCQAQMDQEMAHRDAVHGSTNPEIERFRDRGLIKLLQHHGKL